ncbi:MAG: 50S ribosomal protein L18 [Chitinivibrionales bacterium]|nr:50S ribosomal protein L18 [Chitinivibrionales bacterium]MBD3397221.1 50S ribosomal protein L18 [Chitinivibrionales bacterium]
MDKARQKVVDRKKRARRVRKHVFGTTERPRLCVRRSLKHIYAQIVDDVAGTALVQVGSSAKEVMQKADKNSKTDAAKIVGELIAAKALEKGIERVVFDRKGYPYHGRIKALADAARAKGLAF